MDTAACEFPLVLFLHLFSKGPCLHVGVRSSAEWEFGIRLRSGRPSFPHGPFRQAYEHALEHATA
eukprot:1038755-Pyramimonas_sp.AAC.1